MSKTVSSLKVLGALVPAVLSAAALVAACSRTELPEERESRESVSFVVSGFVPTRAAVTASEDRVVSLDVIAFRQDNGQVDVSGRVEAEGSGTVGSVIAELSSGVPVDWYVVANAPEGAVSACASKAAFLAGVTTLTQGIRSTLVMMGHGSLPGVPQSGSVPVSLDRYACKVTIQSVAVEWQDAFNMGSVSVGRIALVNVVGSTPWSGTPAGGDLWYNKAGLEAGLPAAVEDMLVKDYGGLSVASSSPVDVESPLYCMPNPVVNNDNAKNTGHWTPRTTRLAVELLIGGVSNWYPVDLGSMLPNRHYLIRKLTVTGPGSAGPDYPVERSDIRFTVMVVDWDIANVPAEFSDNL